MDPQVVAAWIAAGISLLTLIGTLAAQYLARRATSRDTEKTFEEQRKHLDRTLAEQSKQLDRTLAEQRTRTLNERFATAAEQLGSEKPAVRIAGVYAMAGLADDWEENRQTCVDVLCAYVRMPHEPDPGQDAPEAQQLAFQGIREVRQTATRVITAHLKEHAAVSWQGLDFDFTGAIFDCGDFMLAQFSGGKVSFKGARFSNGEIHFNGAEFCGARVDFSSAQFSGGTVEFCYARFSGGEVDFRLIEFSGGEVPFNAAHFSGTKVYFHDARFSGSMIDFAFARFSDGEVHFRLTEFSGGKISFRGSWFSGGKVQFDEARFIGSEIRFDDAKFSGGMVDFGDAADWSTPPAFPWKGTPPSGVSVPEAKPLNNSRKQNTVTRHAEKRHLSS